MYYRLLSFLFESYLALSSVCGFCLRKLVSSCWNNSWCSQSNFHCHNPWVFKRSLCKQVILSNFLRKEEDSVEVIVKFREFINYEISNVVCATDGDHDEIRISADQMKKRCYDYFNRKQHYWANDQA